MRLDLIITAEHEAWIQNYIRNMSARLLLVDHKDDSHPAFPLILTLLEKQDRHFIVMFTCWSMVTNWTHYISSFSPSFSYTVLLISGTQKRGESKDFGEGRRGRGADLFLWLIFFWGPFHSSVHSNKNSLNWALTLYRFLPEAAYDSFRFSISRALWWDNNLIASSWSHK